VFYARGTSVNIVVRNLPETVLCGMAGEGVDRSNEQENLFLTLSGEGHRLVHLSVLDFKKGYGGERTLFLELAGGMSP